WFFKITDYADRLLGNIDKIDWPQKIKTAQRNWIGRKEGINITYEIKGSKKTVTCFTTTPVNFGATFIVIAPEHVLVKESKNKKIQEYVTKALKKTEQQRQMEGKEKTGVFTGLYAVNHVTKKEIPIWVADFVLKDVGTGAVQGCPGHDLRDFEFAKKFGLPITRVVVGPDGDRNEITRKEQVIQSGTSGKMVNSDFLNGMEFSKAMQKTMDYFEERGWGERVISFHLRDWLISRQRYWGPPIPMIFCDKCEWQPVPEKDLPVELPFVKDYQPLGEGKAPLEKAPKEWLEVKCPNCGGKARRETDVSDTFLDSSWYFLRYPSIKSNKDSLPGTGKTVLREKLPWDQEVTRRWLPVNAYIGGAEHAVLHLLYSRFVWMCLRDWGYLPKSLGDEPFPFLYSHGLLIKDGAKMSKSRGNVVIPDEYMEKFGTDALRMYLMFIGPYDQGGDFQDTGMMGMRKFLDRVWRLVIAIQDTPGVKNSATPGVSEVGRFRHQTVKRVTQAMENLRYNVGIAALMEYVNFLEFHLRLLTPGVKNSSTPGVVVEAVETLVLLLAPMAPFISEEMWQMLRKSEARSTKFESVHQQAWPTFDEEKARADKVEVVVQVNGKLRARLSLGRDEAQDKEQVFKAAKSEAAVKRYLENKKPVKEIFVKGKLVNLVVR
ncbi:TPA: leucine--tRNA ligase, partial [Candidatus Beckwithbacteria bacterium]|nr:leucine--tRNA ligase [Candidatus Beckwithbacteria bacterium]